MVTRAASGTRAPVIVCRAVFDDSVDAADDRRYLSATTQCSKYNLHFITSKRERENDDLVQLSLLKSKKFFSAQRLLIYFDVKYACARRVSLPPSPPKILLSSKSHDI